MTNEQKSKSEDSSASVDEQDFGADPGRAEELLRSVSKLKRKLDNQQDRIEALTRGQEEGMANVGELRAELALVASERDRLRKQLTQIEGMQTETATLYESDVTGETDAHLLELPSIDELMSTFGSTSEETLPPSHSTVKVDSALSESSGEFQEMISPELTILGSRKGAPSPPSERFLVLLEAGHHTKCPLDQDLLTIGRSESADIKIDGDFISRIHARVLRIGMDTVIEDAGSKNGSWVNGEKVTRHVLKHGDLIRIGSANFRLVDSGAA